MQVYNNTTGMQVCCKFESMQVSRYAGMEYANMQEQKHRSMEVCNYVHKQLCKNAGMQECNKK